MPPFGPSQVNVTPGVLEVPLITVLDAEQVMTPPVAAASGTPKSPSTVAVAVCVQALRPVTVRVYMPGTVTSGSSWEDVNPLGPSQANVAPGVFDPPSSSSVGSPQETVPPEADAVGGSVLPVSVVVAVDVQPFAGSVTVTAYKPAVSATGFCWGDEKPFGPLHEYVTPLVGDEPVNVIVGVVQLITPPEADAPGGVVFVVTAAVAEAVQLLAGFVTVTV